jgi:hypothetical protein
MLFRRFGLDVATAFDLMWREYNPRCTPPWSEQEIWHKVNDAAKVAEEGKRGRLQAGLTGASWRPVHAR